MKQKKELRRIFKIPASVLRGAVTSTVKNGKVHKEQTPWKLTLSFEDAIKSQYMVSLSDSQVIRWIDELNSRENTDEEIKSIRWQIKKLRKQSKSAAVKREIDSLYNRLYKLQFIEDYIEIVMDGKGKKALKDYDEVNASGFTVNGIKYRRFCGTNGGIKTNTIVYVSERLYPELKRRLDNGRNPEMPLVPAKLEAYQALVCSSSVPLPAPRGVIVVGDCITHFKEDVIVIDDSGDGEPDLSYVDGYEVERNNSDGCGFMSPDYSRIVNEALNGDGEHTIAGINTRWAWEKGMLFTFDFAEFAEKIAGTYEVKDAWGDVRDVRDADVILTVSMLKLWDSYDSWEDYYSNCQNNHYELSATKQTDNLDNTRKMNYQFLQSYNLTDEEMTALCQPMINEINDILMLDYRKSLVYLAGYGLSDKNVRPDNENLPAYVRALMCNPAMIGDPFIRDVIYKNITGKINRAKYGQIDIDANYPIVGGDLYALAQSVFGLEVTGLLKAGEVYNRYWSDAGETEIVCFRAPMTCHNNIRRMRLRDDEQAAHWFQYIDNAMLYNAWDTSCDAMNGQDFDSDANFVTNNPIIVKNTRNPRTIMCIQRKAEKKIVSEEDIIAANKIAFNSSIGAITNRITSMYDLLPKFAPDSREYKTLEYRIMCGQLQQQNQIDAAKGIETKSMPEYWYDYRAIDKAGFSEQEEAFQRRICANKKPRFMIYRYSKEWKEYRRFMKDSTDKLRVTYQFKDYDELKAAKNKTPEMIASLANFERQCPNTDNDCLVNRICRLFETEYVVAKHGKLHSHPDYIPGFDYTIMKCDDARDGYSMPGEDVKKIARLRQDFNLDTQLLKQMAREAETREDVETAYQQLDMLDKLYQRIAVRIVPNEKELCNVVLDVCYGGVGAKKRKGQENETSNGAKRFAWALCSDTIIANLLEKADNVMTYPAHVDSDGEFIYHGEQFKMQTKTIIP